LIVHPSLKIKMKFVLLFIALAAVFSTPAAAQDCAICQQIVSFMENWIQNNASIATIEQYVEIVCTLAPESWQQPCDALVDYGVEEAVQFIEQNGNATQLCGEIGLCSSMKKQPVLKISKPMDGNCDICIQVVGLIENWVESNYTEQEIQQYLDQVCSLIPGFSQVCDQVVQYGLSYIIQWIQNDENATDICAQLGLCGNRVPMVLAKRQDECSLCTQFFTILKSFIGNNPNATVQELEQFAQTICNLFPQYSTICEAFANSEINTIISELEGTNGPTVVCQTLGLCSSEAKPKRSIRVD